MQRLIIVVGIISVLFLLEEAFACSSRMQQKQRRQQPKPLIRFNNEGKLKIINFADLHFGENPESDWGPESDRKSTIVIRNLLDIEHPDFVVFTGDQLTGENMYPNGSAYVHIVVKPLVENNYKWASTYGNHDIGPNVTRLEILEAEQEYELSYTTQMNKSLPGVANYYLLIYPPTSECSNVLEEDVPVMIWWFFDSQGGRDNDGQQPHHIDPLVVQWFRDENMRLKELWGELPSLVFFHIPPLEFGQIQDNIFSNPECTGLVDDDVDAQDKDTGIMPALAAAGGVKSVFVGHDHGNAWCCFYGEIQVCYNRHSGYGGYGQWVRGARIVDLDINNLQNLTNYIRLETGEIVDEFPKLL